VFTSGSKGEVPGKEETCDEKRNNDIAMRLSSIGVIPTNFYKTLKHLLLQHVKNLELNFKK
jgi:hypothetical protein